MGRMGGYFGEIGQSRKGHSREGEAKLTDDREMADKGGLKDKCYCGLLSVWVGTFPSSAQQVSWNWESQWMA